MTMLVQDTSVRPPRIEPETRFPIVFGAHDHLFGIVETPNHSDTSTGVVMLTAGMTPCNGPFGLHTRWAEELAARGVPSLRFDLSGIGESFGVGSTGSSLDRAAAETASAMTSMTQSLGCERFVLLGLCSGADDALRAAVDQRVIGCVLIDGLGYPTRRYWRYRLLQHYPRRLFAASVWKRRLRRLLVPAAAKSTRLDTAEDIREFPSADSATEQIQALIDRGVMFHFIYTGGVGQYYNHAGQIWEMLPAVDWKGLATSTFFAEMDHVAMLSEDRRRLAADVVGHIGRML